MLLPWNLLVADICYCSKKLFLVDTYYFFGSSSQPTCTIILELEKFSGHVYYSKKLSLAGMYYYFEKTSYQRTCVTIVQFERLIFGDRYCYSKKAILADMLFFSETILHLDIFRRAHTRKSHDRLRTMWGGLTNSSSQFWAYCFPFWFLVYEHEVL